LKIPHFVCLTLFGLAPVAHHPFDQDPPMIAYVYAADRKTERPEAHLQGFAGILQVDGYGAYAALARRHQQIRLAFCWAHVRRKFYELAEGSPVAAGNPAPHCLALRHRGGDPRHIY
jgi:hypothetical protein